MYKKQKSEHFPEKEHRFVEKLLLKEIF